MKPGMDPLTDEQAIESLNQEHGRRPDLEPAIARFRYAVAEISTGDASPMTLSMLADAARELGALGMNTGFIYDLMCASWEKRGWVPVTDPGAGAADPLNPR